MRNKLVSSLEKLLSEHDCVVVPQLGAFIREHSPAIWDAEQHLAHPPRVVLRFNEALQHQDGLLLEHYADSLGISQRRAKLEIEQDVRQLRQVLLRQQQVDLLGIGSLRLSPEGRLTFSSKPSEMIAYQYYGLYSVLSPVGKDKKQTRALNPSPTEAHIKDYIQINIPKSFLRYAGVVAVVALLVLLPFSIWSPKQHNYQASFVPDKASVAKIIKPSPEPPKEVATQKPIALEAQTAEPQASTYYVIVGTERKIEIAQRYTEYYGERFPNLRIIAGKHNFRISAAEFANAEEAQTFVNELSKENIPAWVYHL